MPVYLVHGFRWPRKAIRIHIILNNVEEAAPEWLMSPTTSAALITNFRVLYPTLIAVLPGLRFIEQHNPGDTSTNAISQPFAFVTDKAERSELSIDVGAVMGMGVGAAGWDALADLRDHLAPGEKIGWFVVYNGDEERLNQRQAEEVANGGDNEVPCAVNLLLLQTDNKGTGS